MIHHGDDANTKQYLHNSFRSYLVMEHPGRDAAGISIPLPKKDEVVMVDGGGVKRVIRKRKRLFVALLLKGKDDKRT